MRTKSSNEALVNHIKNYRMMIGFSQQEFCDYLNDNYNVEVSKYVINGIEHGRSLVSEQLRDALYHTVYHTNINFRDEILNISEKVADAFITINKDLDIKKILSFYRVEEIDSFFEDQGLKSIIDHPLEHHLPQDVILNVYDGKVYMNETALFIYHLCWAYLQKSTKQMNLIQKSDYLSSDFNETATEILNIKDWNELNERSKGRYMININRKLSFLINLDKHDCIKSFCQQIFNTIQYYPADNELKMYADLINKSIDDYTDNDFKNALSKINQCVHLLIYVFAWCQHEIIFPDKNIVTEIKNLFKEIQPENIVCKDKNELISNCILRLESLSDNLLENSEEFKTYAYKLYKLHRRLDSFDFNFFTDFEYQTDVISN